LKPQTAHKQWEKVGVQKRVAWHVILMTSAHTIYGTTGGRSQLVVLIMQNQMARGRERDRFAASIINGTYEQ
jgi:hypothetical protein